MQCITDPKVFISYAWGTDEYQQKVLDFCTRLYSECGIEVLIDKWSMEAGNDTCDFMERCVKDPSVNYVIMLLDKNYFTIFMTDAESLLIKPILSTSYFPDLAIATVIESL